jgi:hypothetical protein
METVDIHAELVKTVRDLLDCRDDTERTYEDAYDFTFKSGLHRECWEKLIKLTEWEPVSKDVR